MNIQLFIVRNIFLYKSFYRLISIAVVVAVAVIIGSLVVGDSVRSTLIKRVEERLGKTETIIFSRYSYLDDAILETLNDHSALDSESRVIGGLRVKPAMTEDKKPAMTEDSKPAMTTRGVLLSNGFVSVSGKLIPVMVWGTDDWGIEKGRTKINQALYNEIKPSKTEDIVLRLPSAGMVPLGSMYVTDTYTTSLRLALDSYISVEQGGNINLKNEQTIPFNIFVNREELAEAIDTPGKINLILSERMISKDDFASAWNYAYSGLNIVLPCHSVLDLDGCHCGLDPQSPEKGAGLRIKPAMTVVTDRIFIQDKVVETLCKNDPSSNRIYSYLANSINSQFSILNSQSSIPYSFITAVDYYEGQPVNPDEIILSDYAAQRLNVRLHDTLSISYFISQQFKTLIEDSVFLKVAKIVPLKDLQADNTLAAEFPGLSNVERCTDWDSDLPINMKLITDEDEDYWTKYKNTPKAIVPYSTLASRWKNAYGSATALRIKDTSRLNDLTYEMFDIQVIYPREAGFSAAQSGVDFASLFLSLGFFIIISAGMLMTVPLSEMLFRRRDELNLLKATGYTDKRITQLLWRESAPVVCFSSVAGVIAGLIFTYFILFLLGTVWKGATHTDGFRVYPDLLTIAAGMSVGIIFSMLLLYIRIVNTLKGLSFPRKQKSPGKRLWIIRGLQLKSAMSSSLIFIALLILNILYLKSPILFVCIGIVFLFAGWTWFEYLINRGVKIKMPFDSSKLIWSSLFHTKKQAMLSFITLASGIFIVFSVGLNRQGFADSSQIRTATGGFSLWCETGVPVYHNVQTEEGRAKLALKDLPKEAQTIQLLKYGADDASCLNLNKVVTPNVLGINMDELETSDFKITKTIFDGSGKDAMHSVSTILSKFKTAENSVYPALVDETVLTWSLKKKLGDTIIYMGEKGETVSIQLAGTIQNSIFQGYILIDKSLFTEIWSEISGSEIMLVNVPDKEIADTKILFSQALNNYGVRVTTTGERMQLFYSVTDTYLTIFLSLGGLGLLLGIFSFIIVVRKNLLARTKEITLYHSLGFDEKRMHNLFYKENIIIPLYAISIGALGSLLGVSMGFGNVNSRIWALSVVFLVIFILSLIIFVKTSLRKYLGRTSE